LEYLKSTMAFSSPSNRLSSNSCEARCARPEKANSAPGWKVPFEETGEVGGRRCAVEAMVVIEDFDPHQELYPKTLQLA
jgi:hypothetical protein